MQKSKHIVIRYSDKFGPTVALHNEVATKGGLVWFGKMGATVADRWVRMFEQQINKGVRTWLYLVKRDGARYSFHKASMHRIEKSPPKQFGDVPAYYKSHNLTEHMSCFFQIESLQSCSTREVSNLRLASSGSSITETLAVSMAGSFIVEQIQPTNTMYSDA